MKRASILLGLALGCSARIDASSATEDDATTAASLDGTATIDTPTSSTTAPATTTASTSVDPDSSESSVATTNDGGYDEDTGGTGCVFTCPPPATSGGGGGGSIECDLAAQDCPEGEKCMPWANDGGRVWNATRCSPLDPNPIADGEVCTVEGSGVSGIDNCSIGSMCFAVDPKTNMGVCHALCVPSGTPCDEDDSCVGYVPGIVELCVDGCDPLASMCDPGTCAPQSEGFTCAPGGEQPLGAPCSEANDCASGSVCVAGNLLPTCDAVGCCAAACDLAEDACEEPLSCVAWDPSASPPWDHIGVCIAEL